MIQPPPVTINFPGLVEAPKCHACRFFWHVETDHKPLDMCTRWRRAAREKCAEFEVNR